MKCPCYSYIGLVKRNSKTLKALVRSDAGRYYVWNVKPDVLESFQKVGGGHISSWDLELASINQIEAGRGSRWSPNQSKVMVDVIFYGMVSGGKVSKTILVKTIAEDAGWSIVAVPSDVLDGLPFLNQISVDSRKLLPARDDHIRAGLGHGKLRRKKRVAVS